MKRQIPSEHQTERHRQEAAQATQDLARQAARRKLLAAVDQLLKTEAGREVWAHLYDACGFKKSSLTRVANGDVAPLSTECKEAQRLIYLDLRKLATPELLAKAEFFAEYGDPTAASDDKLKKGGTKNADA